MIDMRTFQVHLTHPCAKLPTRGSSQAAGLDLYAAQGWTLKPGHRTLISCGFEMALTPGYYMRIAPRSGMALRDGIDVLAGVVDSDYRGDVGVVLINLGLTRYTIAVGDRIAQGIITPYAMWEPEQVDALSWTKRGIGGYGSTGT